MASIKNDKIDLKTKVEVINLVKCGMKKEEVRKKFNLKTRRTKVKSILINIIWVN